jgi:hypothetical protein
MERAFILELLMGSRSIRRRGFSAAGRSSANPATASKAEKKKRCEGARRRTIVIVSGEDRGDPICVSLGHGQSLYTACRSAASRRMRDMPGRESSGAQTKKGTGDVPMPRRFVRFERTQISETDVMMRDTRP